MSHGLWQLPFLVTLAGLGAALTLGGWLLAELSLWIGGGPKP